MAGVKHTFIRMALGAALLGLIPGFTMPAPASAEISQELKEKLASPVPEKPASFKDPVNGVTFNLPQGFKIQGLYTRGKSHQDILMRATKDDLLFVYSSNRAKMKKENSPKEEPFYARDVMLEITKQSYLEEAKEKGIDLKKSEIEKFGSLDGLHIQQMEDGKLSDRYFFGDRKNLYTFSYLVPEDQYPALQPDIAKSLETIVIPTPYERVSIPGSQLTFELPYGGMDVEKAKEPNDPHRLLYLHLDEKLLSGVIYQPLIQNMDYAFLPDSLDNLSERDQDNLCKVITQNRKDRWKRKDPKAVWDTSETYFSKASDRPCIVEETVYQGRKNLGYIFVDKGMFLSLDFMELSPGKQEPIIEHVVNSLQKK